MFRKFVFEKRKALGKALGFLFRYPVSDERSREEYTEKNESPSGELKD